MKNMEVKALLELKLKFQDPKMANAVLIALKPDNRIPYNDVRISSSVINGEVEYKVEFHGKTDSFLRLRNTADDVLEHCMLVVKTLSNVTKRINTTKKSNNTTGKGVKQHVEGGKR